MAFPRELPPAEVIAFATALDGHADELWVIEDCFYTAGVSLAAAALATTGSLTVGIGIMPAVARNPAITAMELATLCGLAPGRVVGGIGHGVQEWMAQIGEAQASPVTTLTEVIDAVRRLLAGERLTLDGRHVRFDGVALELAPDPAPPVLAGVRGPKSLAAAGVVADGVLLAEGAGPSYVEAARSAAGHTMGDGWEVATFASLCVARTRVEAYELAAPLVAEWVERRLASMLAVPFADELVALVDEQGAGGLVRAPAEWWAELGPIGTMDDALAFVESMAEVGVDRIACFPAPDLELARGQLDIVVALAGG